jgi:UDP-glucose 4-epimerase
MPTSPTEQDAPVLVTGGAGFIGSHSVDHLLAAGRRVRVLDNFSGGKRTNLAAHPALEVMQGDIRDPVAVERAVQGVGGVLHLAAQVSVATSVEDPVGSGANNIAGFVNVLDAARRAGVLRFVYASSAAVYGIPQSLPLSEAAPVAPLSPYGLEKSVNDQYAALYRELYGMSTLGLRYFNVYGPRQDPSSPYSGVISVFARRLREGQGLTVNGDGLQTRDFIYVGDVARANAAALASRIDGVCNVATGRSVTLLQLIEALAAVAGATPHVAHGPPRAGDIRDSAADNRRLREQLGIDGYTSLRDGLAELWRSPG